MIADEARQGAADVVLARRDDRRVRDRQAQRPPEQRHDREPVGEAADQRGFGERPRGAGPTVLRQPPRRRDEHGCHDREQHGGRNSHAPQAADELGIRGGSRGGRAAVHPKTAAISFWKAAAA